MKPFRINFIGVGVRKSGTTWITDSLRNHPGVFIPPKKELIYFNKEMPDDPRIMNYRFNKSYDWYHHYYKDSLPGQLNGEFSPHYFYSDEAIERIFAYNSSVKIIAVIRNPVERTLSNYRYAIQIGVIKKMGIEAALEVDPSILKHSFYSNQLEKWILRFGRENVGVFFFDDIVNQPEKIFENICRFLNVPVYSIRNMDVKSNATKANRINNLNYLITQSRTYIHKHQLLWIRPLLKYSGITYLAERIKSLNEYGESEVEVLPDVREMLLGQLLTDIEKTELLLNKDLSHWKKIEESSQFQ